MLPLVILRAAGAEETAAAGGVGATALANTGGLHTPAIVDAAQGMTSKQAAGQTRSLRPTQLGAGESQ